MLDRGMELLRIAAMPLALGLVGYWIQSALQEDQLRSERLKLAVGVLSDVEVSPPPRTLAVDLLEKSMPEDVALDRALRSSLESGEATFPMLATSVGAGSIALRGIGVGEAIQNAPQVPDK